ncbi:unnamed protein product [Ceutorhynchus assimilis]|uniref:Uncharacterized protein n=1 Tax=Ceutorhynchus assimilis TaxID=467358 RepID=A0A9N9MSF3_9CUCU|nr:unnamed protein product [Ceutorhynchus assimilis]
MTAKHKGTGFMKPVDGLNLVKKGQYAFQVELVTGYPIIEREFEETMICELKEISIYGMTQLHANYQKWSPFKDIMDVWVDTAGRTTRSTQRNQVKLIAKVLVKG